MANLRKIFSKIYDRYIDKIYRFIFLKVNSQEIAQDLTSETFLRGWESFKNGNKIENPQAFLYRIARNLVTDYYREKGRAQVVSAEYVPIADPRQDLEEKAMLTSDINIIRKALAGLSEDYQNVIIWHYLDDLPIPEIAVMLDRTEEATRVLLSRALKALRNECNKTS
jgi:RNA polymerase sigma-70 factor (ECF subfamily)